MPPRLQRAPSARLRGPRPLSNLGIFIDSHGSPRPSRSSFQDVHILPNSPTSEGESGDRRHSYSSEVSVYSNMSDDSVLSVTTVDIVLNPDEASLRRGEHIKHRPSLQPKGPRLRKPSNYVYFPQPPSANHVSPIITAFEQPDLPIMGMGHAVHSYTCAVISDTHSPESAYSQSSLREEPYLRILPNSQEDQPPDDFMSEEIDWDAVDEALSHTTSPELPTLPMPKRKSTIEISNLLVERRARYDAAIGNV